MFSSNVLEHVGDLPAMLDEMARVLAPGGVALHVMPTHHWRLWTSIGHYADLSIQLLRCLPLFVPRALSFREISQAPVRGLRAMGGTLWRGRLPDRHGERGNVVTEWRYFHPSWWRRLFAEHGWQLLEDRPLQLFYSGYMVLGPRLSLRTRRMLSRPLGAACHLYRMRPMRPDQ